MFMLFHENRKSNIDFLRSLSSVNRLSNGVLENDRIGEYFSENESEYKIIKFSNLYNGDYEKKWSIY